MTRRGTSPLIKLVLLLIIIIVFLGKVQSSGTHICEQLKQGSYSCQDPNECDRDCKKCQGPHAKGSCLLGHGSGCGCGSGSGSGSGSGACSCKCVCL